MAGYRDRSNYEPFGPPDFGRPLRPFNKVQWVGAGLVVAGILAMLAVLTSRFGWVQADTKDWLPVATTLCALGAVLINSRRQKMAPEETARRRRQTLIAVLVALALCTAAVLAILYFKEA